MIYTHGKFDDFYRLLRLRHGWSTRNVRDRGKKQSVLSTERTSQSIKETKHDSLKGDSGASGASETTPRYSRRGNSRFWTRENLVAMCFAEWLGRECRWGFCCGSRRTRVTIPRSSCWISHHHLRRRRQCHQQSQWKPLDYYCSPCHRA